MESVVDNREDIKDFLDDADLEQYFTAFRDTLKVTKISQLKFVMTEDLVQIGMSKPEQRRYKKTYSRYFRSSYMVKIRKFLGATKKNESHGHGHAPGAGPGPNHSHSHGHVHGHPSSVATELQSFPDGNVKIPTKHIISIEDITINKELGMGQFGVVQQGTWTTGTQRLQVAIKCLGQERMSSDSSEFLKEAAVMHTIEHPNIVRLYGVVLHLDSLMLVTELAPLRSLLECLRDVTLRPNFPMSSLADFAEQICEGMAYLERKRLIHRDLAARNILVFNKECVKISDFGLSRALGVGKDYYQTNYSVNLKLPVAWCAPECILFLRFTSSSDVWAYGVCLWELFTYGHQPWAALSGQQILEAIDEPNFQRLERPECCTEEFYALMLECWSHDPNERPTFKELLPQLRSIQPDQVQATTYFQRPEDGRRSNFLEYKNGDIITVVGKENMTKTALWYGVLPGGACGLFDPISTKPYIKPEKVSVSGAIAPHPSRSSLRSIRSSLRRSDVKRHTYTGKRAIQRSMISSPQGDVKHTGHVGLDGAYFGDISFLDPAGCPPCQVVTPYKPLEDEQVPLINPHSPSHFTGASTEPAYPLLSGNDVHSREYDMAYDSRTKSLKKYAHKSVAKPTTSRGILNKVKSATIGRGYKAADTASKADEDHEYHEISDTDTESNAAISRGRYATQSESSGMTDNDFSQSLLDEMDAVLRHYDSRRREEAGTSRGQSNFEPSVRTHTTIRTEKKKASPTDTMKPMSAHDQKTLETAVAMAHELTTKSMTDLDGAQKPTNYPTDRSKIHMKIPLSEKERRDEVEECAGKSVRRNFSEVAKSVPDIQVFSHSNPLRKSILKSTITEESKHAYTSLIEEPMPSTSLVNQMNDPLLRKPSTIPKPGRAASRQHFHSLQKQNMPVVYNMTSSDFSKPEAIKNPVNVLPLPPRTAKPKLLEMPRHVRKHPLKVPELKPPLPPRPVYQYQNASHPALHKANKEPLTRNGAEREDPARAAINRPGPSWAQPITCAYLYDNEINMDMEADSEDDADLAMRCGLVKGSTDHVSVEDLLAFAGQKPCGRQRGVESDEVRIMNKVLKEQVTPEQCLETLEICDWNVHQAIKVVRVRISVGDDVTPLDCLNQLEKAGGDIAKASTVMRINKN